VPVSIKTIVHHFLAMVLRCATGSIKRGGRFMLMLAVGSILVGAVLGLHFKVFVLIPVILSALAVLAGTVLAWEIGMDRIALEMVAVATALQLGYLSPMYGAHCRVREAVL
jgi:hypothetical protein